MDRIDIHVGVQRVKYEEMISDRVAESSDEIAARVTAARNIQLKRFAGTGIYCNTQMTHRQIKTTCLITAEAQELLRQVFEKMKLNARSYDRIIKVAQTIADLSGEKKIGANRMAEAIQLRVAVSEQS